MFKDDCKAKLQSLTFCGVGAHQQTGLVELKIKHLTLAVRTMLLHAQRPCPEYITTMLWLCALLTVADQMNISHIDIVGNSPELNFSKVAGGTTKLGNFHTFSCPVYVLDSRLQDIGGLCPAIWNARSRLGTYLGHSPSHAGSVVLVLNPKISLVSPRYHVVFDDDFSTVPNLQAGSMPNIGKFQSKTQERRAQMIFMM